MGSVLTMYAHSRLHAQGLTGRRHHEVLLLRPRGEVTATAHGETGPFGLRRRPVGIEQWNGAAA
jgi:hypothetical protein